MDAYIRQSLKNRVSEQQPHPNGRARLLLVAASIQREQQVVSTTRDTERDRAFRHPSPVDQAMKIYNLPGLWIAHVSLTPIRSVT
jgi:hypothetical protein